jgi:hypothetical protein
MAYGVPYGKRVRLIQDFDEFAPPSVIEAVEKRPATAIEKLNFGISSALIKEAQRGTTAKKSLSIIPKDSEGTVSEGPYCGGIFDYSKEWPVQFDRFKDHGDAIRGKGFTVGVPPALLKIIENKGTNQSKRKVST